MTPFYEQNGITIYHGDCRQVLPFLPQFDLLLTDPPYGMEYQSNYRKQKHRKIQNDSQLPLSEIYLALSKADVAAYVFCRWDNLPQMPVPKSVIAWVKNNWSMGDLDHEYGRQWEACCFYARKNHRFTKRPADVLQFPRTKNENHPTEKPVSLLTEIISHNRVQTVFDPFVGSGTTLVAAKRAGLQAVGIELEEAHCDRAVSRLEQGFLKF